METQDIDETVHEAIERESSWWLKAIALTTALLATLAAAAALTGLLPPTILRRAMRQSFAQTILSCRQLGESPKPEGNSESLV